MLIKVVRLCFLVSLSVVYSSVNHLHASPHDGGLQIGVAADLLGVAPIAKGSPTQPRLIPREAELMLSAAADPYWNGLLSLAAHRESGESFFEIHELALQNENLIPSVRFKLGQYFLGIGRLNRFHRHDWPFIDAPEYHRVFFDQEGLLDSGAEASWLLPLPFFLEWTGGVTSGWNFGHSHDEGFRPQIPTLYSRFGFFLDSTSDSQSNLSSELGFNLVKRRDHEGTDNQTLGMDWTSKWELGGIKHQIRLQSEFWYRKIGADRAHGGYLFPEYQLNPRWTFGVRGDWFIPLSLTTINGSEIQSNQWTLAPQLSLSPSEFTRFRFAFQEVRKRLNQRNYLGDRLVQLQITFILGAHPSHNY